MKNVMILFIKIFCISLLGACSSNSKPQRMLNQRAEYDPHVPSISLIESDLVRKKAKEVEIYIFPHEMPSGDFFKGGTIQAIVGGERWEYQKKRKVKKRSKRKKRVRTKKIKKRKTKKRSVSKI